MLSDFLRQPPQASRVIAGLVLFTSLSVHLGILDPNALVFVPQWTFQQWPPQLWRIVTPFFLTAPKLAIILDTYFLYRDANECEKRFSHTADFVWFGIFNALIILLLNYLFVGGFILTQGLNVAFAYYWSANEPASTNFNFYFANFSARFLPYLMIAVLLLTRGQNQALVGLTGLLASHLYIFFTIIYPRYAKGTNFLATPKWLYVLLEGDNRSTAQAYGHTSNSTARSALTTGRVSSDSGVGIWRRRGAGHRLGG